MSGVEINIENCNNISYGELTVVKNKLNIKYGMNGTGKSTLSTAIDLVSRGEDLNELKPFGSNEDVEPKVSLSEEFQTVKVFNEDFVNNMVFKESTVIENAFDVFIRTTDYEQRRKELDERLVKLKVDIDSKEQIVQLREDISAFAGKLELNAAKNSIKNNTNYKAIIKKHNIYNIPNKLEKYTPIISDNQICINWIDWKTKGESFDTKGICPYCSDELTERFEEEKKEFKDTYKKSDAQNLKIMSDLFEKFHKYMSDEKYNIIDACIKEEKEANAINIILISFINEYNHISSQLYKISSFDKSVFRQSDIKDIDKILESMKLEKSIFNFFSNDYFMEIVDLINNSLEELRKEAIEIKKAIGKLQSVLKKLVAASQNDINDFLDSAGISYHVGIDIDETGQAIATLQYINNKDFVQVDKIRNHLSWGERNAFSLILFMFYAISENADFIVLDDPISSFDTNKKYAIIHRMFGKQAGIVPRSFYKKTVMLLTHDFEPIIDFGVVGKLPKEVLEVKFISNNYGNLEEKDIDFSEDIRPVVQALASYVKDESLGIVHRIAFLRKYYEHNGIADNLEAYNVLSSLIHGHAKCKYKNNDMMPQNEVDKGCEEIRKWIIDFDYDRLYQNVYNEGSLSAMYFEETNAYLKIQIFRALFEIDPSKEIKEEDVLIKFINESYHIENDYAYYLDMIKYETVPEYISVAIEAYMNRIYLVEKK